MSSRAANRRSKPRPDAGPGTTAFARRLLDWYAAAGRHDLPWQGRDDPYRIWVSEIMLQQTQVATVIPYFDRFMERFATLIDLANAPLDAVLHIWTGLGYYARARNLHRAAGIVRDEHRGVFPDRLDAVQELPGIGRSTAGAILAFAFGQRQPILDGNAKRVLARHYAIDRPAAERATENRLWRLAARNTPVHRVADYTQAIMDLGATVCTRTRPRCDTCPVTRSCRARIEGRPERYPGARARKPLPTRSVVMLLIRNHEDAVLLERRAPMGVWGGLWCFPQCDPQHDPIAWSAARLALDIVPEKPLATVRHGFSHFRLDIRPLPARLIDARPVVMESADRLWYNVNEPIDIGLAAPVQRLLAVLRSERIIEGGRISDD